MLNLELIENLEAVPPEVPLLTVPVSLSSSKELVHNTTTVYNVVTLATAKGAQDGHTVNVNGEHFRYSSEFNTWINYNLARRYLVKTSMSETDYTMVLIIIQNRKGHLYPSKLIDSDLAIIGKLETPYNSSKHHGEVPQTKKDTKKNTQAKFESFRQTLNI